MRSQLTGVNRPGGDYNVFNARDANACQDACVGDARCMAFTYVNAGIQGPSGRCWLKSSVPGAQGNSCCVSGIRRQAGGGGVLSLENNVNRPGSDYSNFNLSSPDPRLCQAQCAADGQCRAYTYVKPAQGYPAHCWLKNAVPPAQLNQCCVSGARQ